MEKGISELPLLIKDNPIHITVTYYISSYIISYNPIYNHLLISYITTSNLSYRKID